MRIGLIAPPWIPVPPPAYGGTEAVIADLATGLSARGHEVRLFTVGESTSQVPRTHLFRTAVSPMGQGLPEAAHVLAAYRDLRDMDVIHDHTLLGPLVGSRVGSGGPPVVTTNHGPFTELTIPIFREIARTAWVVAISADQARTGQDVPIAATIHHGIDVDVYRPGPGDAGHLAFVGRMSPNKGVDAAVRIAHAAQRPLRIVSKMREPEEYEYFKSAVQPLLSKQDDEVAELGLHERVEVLRHAAGLVNPIAWPEPFGLVMVEAMATGTPVIARPAGAAPEIVTHRRTGFLCSTEEEAVRAVAALPAIDRVACRAEAESRFSLQRMAADYERLYLRIRAATRAPSRWRSDDGVRSGRTDGARVRAVG